MKYLLSTAIALAGLCAAASSASASIVLNLTSVTPSGGSFIWKYSADLEPDTNLRVNDYVVIYDVQGLAAGTSAFSASVAGTFGVTEPATGAIPPLVAPTQDLAGVKNVQITLTAGSSVVPTVGGPAVHLGDLTFTSAFGLTNINGEFASQTQQKSGGVTFSAIGLVEVPAVPEPAGLALLGAPAAMLLRRRR